MSRYSSYNCFSLSRNVTHFSFAELTVARRIEHKMASSLSPLQISQLKDSWSVLAQDPSQLASALVIRLFKENPEYQSLFKRLKDLSIDELASNPQFMSHASKVGAALASTIDHLDKPEELEKLLTDLGLKHKKYGLSAKHFQVIGAVLVAMIAEAIGDSEPELLELWKSSLTSVLSIIIAACV